MKGLLKKDFYMIIKNCRVVIIAIAMFLVIGTVSETPYFLMFSAIMAGVISFTLISYDENYGWNIYADVLPVTRKEQVSAKYLITLIFVAGSMFIAGLVLLIKGIINNNFSLEGFMVLITVFLLLGFMSPALLLPAIYKFGLQKGRIVYYLLIGCISAIAFTGLQEGDPIQKLSFLFKYEWIFIPAPMILFAVSWFISMAVYNKKEIA